jgi:hypothetical protein
VLGCILTMMKKRTLLIGFCGNLLIAFYGILMAFHGFNSVFGVMLYFGKHDNHFPDGIESWIYPTLQECRDALIRLFIVFLVLLLFNSIFGVWIWLSKKRDASVA